jgi:hypothetical protein
MLTWPPSVLFTHVEEQFTESGPDGARWPISPALTNVFLPERESIMEEYLRRTRCSTCGRLDPPPFSDAAKNADAKDPGSVSTLSGRITH